MEIKPEANLIKVQVDKVADKIVVGVNKEEHTINLYYVDNKHINFNMMLPEDTGGIKQEVLEERARTIVDKQLSLYKKEFIKEMHKGIMELQQQTLATSMLATSAASIANSSAYMTTGNSLYIKITDLPPKINFI